MDSDAFVQGRLVISAMLLLVLAGCSGSTQTNTAVASTDPPPASEPPADETPDEDPPAEQASPSVTFDAADQTVPAGQTTVLSWQSTAASSCQASGGWSGAREVQGSATVGPVQGSTTFTLTCSNGGGSTVAMLSVGIVDVVSLAWQPPAENQDGSPLTDLSGYRIHYGSFSRNYTDDVVIDDASTTNWDLNLPSGDHYIAMTAFDAQGNESGYSNEIVRSVN
ncbi:MAG: hypothetical protein GVY21_10140 [Gammaproteobacteria bacterium]|jgi:hypothetical protein|nr:hypothetical protein [Gammaproteobacteria bacterium]